MTVPSTSLENHNHGPSKTLTRSFRDVAAQALPPRAYRNCAKRTYNQKPAVHRNSSYKHAVFYFVEKESLNLIPEFQKARNVRFPFGTCLGTHATDDSQGKIIEVILNNQSAVEDAVNTPILIGLDKKFYATPAVPQDNIILKVHLSKLPFLPVADLHATLVDNFSRFGNVRDVTIYLDDESKTAFCGNGAIFLDRSIDPTSPKAWDKLTYKIDLGNQSFCLGKWAKMESHCVYCKQMGHTPRHCPRAHDNSIASSKKGVRNEEQPFVPSINKVLINPVPSIHVDDNFTTPSTTAVNPANEDVPVLQPSNYFTVLSDNESMMDVSEDDNDRLTDAEEPLLIPNDLPVIVEERSAATTSVPKTTPTTVANSATTHQRVSPRANKGVSAIKYDPSSSSPISSIRKTSA
ncbi:hypothetical protein INT47_012940 [Mucor saturninus]|uniref:CCHC-type domain-containing protein n=1 Tax=Mucor saturninus TaxID=64648 RepID=A0A8H7QXD1_9FUNG|nr:hypothetical protein INT47_012940 [Mucor saturninus]